MKITLKDGAVRELEGPMSALEVRSEERRVGK